MDKFKDHLQRHKANLDLDSPASDTWEGIESKLPARSGFPKWVIRYAAAACVIALAGAGLWLVIRDNGKKPSDVAKYPGGAKKQDSGKEKIETATRKEESAPIRDIAKTAPKPSPARHSARAQRPAGASDEITAIGKGYSSLIDYQLRKLRATPLYAENSQYFSFYVEQFKQMDQDERDVRRDIKTYGLTNEFLEQLINVYQQKLNVLKNLQTEINKMNNKVRERQSPLEKVEVHYLNI